MSLLKGLIALHTMPAFCMRKLVRFFLVCKQFMQLIFELECGKCHSVIGFYWSCSYALYFTSIVRFLGGRLHVLRPIVPSVFYLFCSVMYILKFQPLYLHIEHKWNFRVLRKSIRYTSIKWENVFIPNILAINRNGLNFHILRHKLSLYFINQYISVSH